MSGSRKSGNLSVMKAGIRTGFGYDSHRFGPGDGLVLGGVKVPCRMGFVAHSDGDVVLHAITDAILGAIGAGDIGELFPDDDDRWQGADSTVFVHRALEIAAERDYHLGNADITIIIETPKLGGLKPEISKNIAKILEVDDDQVNVKAKTNERMGALGRCEGIAVMASVLMSIDD